MTGYMINAIALFLTARLIRKIPCCQNNRGELVIKNPFYEGNDNLTTKRKQKIGGVTYTVTSVFNQKAKGDVVDKISRLIDRDIANIRLDDAVNK
jgi:hypothetical protein